MKSVIFTLSFLILSGVSIIPELLIPLNPEFCGIAFIIIYMLSLLLITLINKKIDMWPIAIISIMYATYTIQAIFLGTEYGLTKVIIAFFSAIFAALTFFLSRISLSEYPRLMRNAALFFALAALIFKLKFGFFERNIRFGFLGPITFGWVIGFGLISSFYLCLANKQFNEILFICIFIGLLLWSNSKGPLIGILPILLLIFIKLKGLNFRIFFPAALIALALLATVIKFSENIRMYKSIEKLIINQDQYLEGAGQGSIGLRLQYAQESIDIFSKNLIFGAGLGQWSELTKNEHIYPHNVYLEILSECGLIGSSIFFLLLLTSLIKAKENIFVFSIISYALIVISFSGDISYLKFSLFFILCHAQKTVRTKEVARIT